MKLNGISKAQLQQMLEKMGVSKQDQEKAASIFDAVDTESMIRGNVHKDGVLRGLEMQAFLEKASSFLGDKIDGLRETFIKTGEYSETFSDESRGSIRSDFDTNGNVVREIWDQEADGKPDDITEYEYDERGHKTRDIWDKDADGKPDEITEYKYDKRGHKTREIWDQDADGKPDLVRKYEYDERGNMTRESVESANGKIDLITEFEYDERGNMTRAIWDYGADGKPDEITKYEYDERDNLTREIQDNNVDGKPDYITENEYDERGNRTRMVLADGDGEILAVNEVYSSVNYIEKEPEPKPEPEPVSMQKEPLHKEPTSDVAKTESKGLIRTILNWFE